MSLVNRSIIKHKMGLLNLAEELHNVSQACRVMCQRRSNSGPPCTLIAEVKVTHPCIAFLSRSARRA
jgi:hypothetical protein